DFGRPGGLGPGYPRLEQSIQARHHDDGGAWAHGSHEETHHRCDDDRPGHQSRRRGRAERRDTGPVGAFQVSGFRFQELAPIETWNLKLETYSALTALV